MLGEIYYIEKHNILVILYGTMLKDSASKRAKVLVTFACRNEKETALAKGTTLDEMTYIGNL